MTLEGMLYPGDLRTDQPHWWADFKYQHSGPLTDRTGNNLLDNVFDITPLDTGESMPFAHTVLNRERDPSDPIYLADVTLQNVVVGSAYWLADANDLSRVLSSGTVTISGKSDGEVGTFVISNVAAYSPSFLMELRLRKGTSGDKYQSFKIFAFHSGAGASIYCSQIPDTVA